MTINGLHEVLPKAVHLSFTKMDPLSTSPFTLAIDAPQILFASSPISSHHSNHHLHHLFRKAHQLIMIGVVPIFCFDGKGPWRAVRRGLSVSDGGSARFDRQQEEVR
jgi:hypothetical protein